MRLDIKMPKIWDKCVEEIKMKIKKGEMPKTYVDKIIGKRLKSNPYKICRRSRPLRSAFLLKEGKKQKGL